MLKKRFWAGLCSFFLVLTLVFGPSDQAIAFTDEQNLLLQAWRYVSQSYVDETFNHQNWWILRQKFLKRPLETREQAYDAISEMLTLLDDPYTRLLRPEQYRSLKVSTSGELSGVGLQINVNPESGILEVILPLPGSPAEAAGIESKDQIIAIDGIDTQNIGLDEAAARMRGKKGTPVSLTIKTPKTDTVTTVKVIRDTIALNPVYAKLDEKNGEKVGYIRLNQFSANAQTEISKSLDQLQQQGQTATFSILEITPVAYCRQALKSLVSGLTKKPLFTRLTAREFLKATMPWVKPRRMHHWWFSLTRRQLVPVKF